MAQLNELRQQFTKISDLGNLGQAYLISGGDNISRNQLAEHISKSFLNLNEDVELDNIPDIVILKSDEANIKLDEVREFRSATKTKGFASGKKAFMLIDAEKISPAGFNALLKTIEEPADDQMFIFTAKSANSILPTILSRVQQIVIDVPRSDTMNKLLANGIEPMLARLGSAKSGDYETALQYIKQDWINDAFLDFWHFFKNLIQQNSYAFIDVSTHLIKTFDDREKQAEFFFMMDTFLNEILQNNRQELVDLTVGKQADLTVIAQIVEMNQLARIGFKSNVSFQVVVEAMVLELIR